MNQRILEGIKEDLEHLEMESRNEGYTSGFDNGFNEGIATQISKIKFEQGDIIVLKSQDISHNTLDKLRLALTQFGVVAIISIKKDEELSKLGDINLGLLGLQRKPK